MLTAKINRDFPLEEEEEKRLFYEEAFGEDFWPKIEHIYQDAESEFKSKKRFKFENINNKKAAMKINKPDYKELMINVL